MKKWNSLQCKCAFNVSMFSVIMFYCILILFDWWPGWWPLWGQVGEVDLAGQKPRLRRLLTGKPHPPYIVHQLLFMTTIFLDWKVFKWFVTANLWDIKLKNLRYVWIGSLWEIFLMTREFYAIPLHANNSCCTVVYWKIMFKTSSVLSYIISLYSF